jgi:hypothetical protein
MSIMDQINYISSWSEGLGDMKTLSHNSDSISWQEFILNTLLGWIPGDWKK